MTGKGGTERRKRRWIIEEEGGVWLDNVRERECSLIMREEGSVP